MEGWHWHYRERVSLHILRRSYLWLLLPAVLCTIGVKNIYIFIEVWGEREKLEWKPKHMWHIFIIFPSLSRDLLFSAWCLESFLAIFNRQPRYRSKMNIYYNWHVLCVWMYTTKLAWSDESEKFENLPAFKCEKFDMGLIWSP